MLALALLGILTTLAVPTFALFFQHAEADVRSSQLLRAINLTRSAAIFQHTRVRLCSSLNQTTCSGSWQDGLLIITATQVLYSLIGAPTTGILHWRTFPQQRAFLEYLPSGLSNMQNGTFWFCQKNAIYPAWAIIINHTGRPRLVHPNQQNKILVTDGKPLYCQHFSPPLRPAASNHNVPHN